MLGCSYRPGPHLCSMFMSDWKPSVQNLPYSLQRKSSFWLVAARRERVTLDAYASDVIDRLP